MTPPPEANHPAHRRRTTRAERGFTLLELLVVLVILGLIASFAAPQVMNYLGGAKSDAAKIQIANLSTALDLYRLDVGRYPTADQGLDGAGRPARRGGKMERALCEAARIAARPMG